MGLNREVMTRDICNTALKPASRRSKSLLARLATPFSLRRTLSYLLAFVMISTMLVAQSSLVEGQTRPRRAQGTKPKPAQPKPAPQAEDPPVVSGDVMEQARAASTQDERIKLLERALASKLPSEVEAEARDLLIREYALRGEQQLREGNPQTASRDFKAAFKLVPSPVTDRTFGQFIFPMPVAMNSFGFRAESAELMKSFESRFADDPNRLLQIGFFYIQIEAPIEAVRVFEGVVKKSPDNHRAYNGLGSAYLINLRLDEAEAAFKKSLELNPKDEYANLNLANLSRAFGDYRTAVDYYSQQIHINDKDPEAYGGLGLSLAVIGQDVESERALRRATEIAPNDYRQLVQLAYFHLSRRKIQLARAMVEQAARIEPRYAWTHIIKGNVDLLEAKYGDALTTMISAQQLANFPTLTFELVKTLMAVDGYDQAIDVLNRSFKLTEEGEFSTMLGGVLQARSPRLDLLLERERRASLFLNEQVTTPLQYRLAEALGRIEYYSKIASNAKNPPEPKQPPKGRKRPGQPQTAQPQDDSSGMTRPRRAEPVDTSSHELTAGLDANLPGVPQLLHALTVFTTLDDGRQPFRMIWASRKLAERRVLLDAAEQLARRALAMAESATEPDGSMRDAPMLDREGRKNVFIGRCYDALGWALLKKGNTRGAVENLIRAVQIYPDSPEAKSVTWHLAVATEEVGDTRRALELYMESYEPGLPTSEARKAQIEVLYKKVYGSLAGLEEKLKK
jgi:tetratricopeptide (TPR) repeat protein